MFMTADMYAQGPPGRTEAMIPLVRKTFGDDFALYADSNSFYTVPEAIRVGRLLEQYKYEYFEEPVMFDQLEDIKQVADALTLPIANGEQDYSFYGFRWLLAHDGLEVVQPDNYYFAATDHLLETCMACGTKIMYRLGTSIEHTRDRHFNTAVPDDVEKYAEILAGIVRHYIHGWANGFDWGIA